MDLYDDRAAYRAVMTKIEAKVPNRSPQTWLAEQLGVTRQVVHWWQDHGIPQHHADTIAGLLDMFPAQVCPGLVITYLPESIFSSIVRRTTSKKTFPVVLINLLKLGLGIEKQPNPTPKPAKDHQRSVQIATEQPMKPIGGFIPISAEELTNQRDEARKAGADLSIRWRSK